MNPKNNLFLNAKFIETYTTSSYIKYPNYLYYWYHIFIYQIIFNQTGRVNTKYGIDITAQEMVAVREELLQGLSIQDIQTDFNL